MKRILWISIVVFCLTGLLTSLKTDSSKIFKIQFDSTKEVSGQKFAIQDISPGLPENWGQF
ncbi:MAG: hypothetical protein AB2L24_09165 [Mangrovibacterium sp.]